jgi:hypothetical protein
MGWAIYFWAIAAWLLLPMPFKISGYITGKDDSPRAAKIEEVLNTLFFLVGLLGFYGYVYQVHLLTPLFWRAWVVLAVAISLAGLVWASPKLRYGISVLGQARVKVLVGVSFLVYAPMLVGVWRSGA